MGDAWPGYPVGAAEDGILDSLEELVAAPSLALRPEGEAYQLVRRARRDGVEWAPP